MYHVFVLSKFHGFVLQYIDYLIISVELNALSCYQCNSNAETACRDLDGVNPTACTTTVSYAQCQVSLVTIPLVMSPKTSD